MCCLKVKITPLCSVPYPGRFVEGKTSRTDIVYRLVTGTRTISYSYTSKKGTGTGEAVLLVETIDGYHIGKSSKITY